MHPGHGTRSSDRYGSTKVVVPTSLFWIPSIETVDGIRIAFAASAASEAARPSDRNIIVVVVSLSLIKRAYCEVLDRFGFYGR
jgi:hypothetical protein